MIRKKKHWMTKIITGISISMILFLAGCGVEEKEPVVEENEDVKEKNLDEDIYPNFSEIELEDTVYTYQVAYSIQKDEEWYVKIRVFQNREEMEELVINKSDCAGTWLRKDELIEEADVDFDGNKDILIRMGEKYRCYLYREGEFKYCEGFEEIREPEVYEAQHLLISKAEKDDEKFRLDRYEIIDDTVQKADSVELRNKYKNDEIIYDIAFYQGKSDWLTAYQYIVNAYEKSDSKYNYNLIYFDDDNIPELVVENIGCTVSLYTFSEGSICNIMYRWQFGWMGIDDYMYAERENLLFSFDQNYAGMERIWDFLELADSHEFVMKCSFKSAYEDEEGNVLRDEDKAGKWNDYYCAGGESEYVKITDEEWDLYKKDLFAHEFLPIRGEFDKDGIKNLLYWVDTRKNIYDL